MKRLLSDLVAACPPPTIVTCKHAPDAPAVGLAQKAALDLIRRGFVGKKSGLLKRFAGKRVYLAVVRAGYRVAPPRYIVVAPLDCSSEGVNARSGSKLRYTFVGDAPLKEGHGAVASVGATCCQVGAGAADGCSLHQAHGRPKGQPDGGDLRSRCV